MEFRVLGPLEILDGERRLPLGGAKRRAVASLLLLDANQVVSTERLVDGVWGDDPPASAVGSLQNHVLRLRRELGDRLVTRAPGYLLRAEPGELDLERFRGLVEKARTREPEEAAALLRQALALWRGAALADLAREPVGAAAGPLEEQRLDALELRIDADLALGRHAELVAELEALVTEQPFRERLRAQHLLALYRSGRQADAHAAYAAARSALVEELGAEPGAELQELHRAILRQDPDLGGGAPTTTGAAGAQVEEVRKTVTVLIADLAAPGSGDPERRREGLLRLRTEADATVAAEGGTLGTTADDRLLAIFGVPLAHDDDALRAVRAAFALRDAGVVTRAVLATGDVITGDPGRGRPLISGPPLDEADRLRSAAGDGDVLVGERAWRLVRHAVVAEPATLGNRVTCIRADAEGVVRWLDSAFVGREDELAEIAAALARVGRERRGRLLTVLGSPGVGKTRLAREVVAAATDATCLFGRTPAYGDGATYAPLRDALTDAAAGPIGDWTERLLEGDDDAAVVAAKIAAAVGESTSVGPVEETAWAARRTLERLAGERPVLLILEDLHWAAPAFLDLVEHVAELARGPILIVVLARPDLLDVRPRWGGGGVASSSILLDVLAPAQASELLDGLAADTTLDADRRDAILAIAGGNPLFIEQLLASALEGDDAAVPDTVHALLAARFDRLGDTERRVAQAAAVCGQTFSADLVASLVGEDVAAALVRLARRDFVDPEPAGSSAEDRWSFRHALVRDEAYASIPKRRRADLHERVANLVDGRAAVRGLDADELVGHHLASAYEARVEVDPDAPGLARLARDAAARLAAAGRRTRDERDAAKAVALLRRARELLPADAPERVGLAPYFASALNAIDERDAALRTLDDAEDHVPPGDRLMSARISLVRHGIRLWGLDAGNPEEVFRDARDAIEILSEAGDDEWTAFAHVLAYHASYRRPASAAEKQLAATVELGLAAEHARAAGSRVFEGYAVGWLCVVLRRGSWPAEYVESVAAEVLADPPTQAARASALGLLGTLRAMQGAFDEGRALLAQSHALLEDLGLPQSVAADLIAVADVELIAGEDAAAERILRESLDRLDALGDRFSAVNAGWRLAFVLLRGGRVDEADAVLARVAGYEGGEYVHAWRCLLEGAIAALRGDPAAAHDLIAQVDRTLPELFEGGMHADVLVETARVCTRLGDVASAVERLRRAAAMARRVDYVVTERAAEAELAALGARVRD